MYIELIDLLRCPRVHDESWLVAAFNRMDGRFVIDGKLGCPVCGASYPISGGVANLGGNPTPDHSATPAPSAVEIEAAALRAAAMLGLTRAGSAALIVEMPGQIAGVISDMTPVRVVAANSTGETPPEHENVAMLTYSDRMPFASGSLDGVMFGPAATEDDVKEAVRVLKTGGRIVVPADSTLRANLKEIARDDHFIVAESTGPLIGLTR